MSRLMTKLVSFLSILSAAAEASNAMKLHHQPSEAALRTLGIDPRQMRAVKI